MTHLYHLEGMSTSPEGLKHRKTMGKDAPRDVLRSIRHSWPLDEGNDAHAAATWSRSRVFLLVAANERTNTKKALLAGDEGSQKKAQRQ
mmetsp:Transcript_40642/g.122352  ORF Transcript_40642/g.122352 Transcript_40642/m.122352 type:complete len:89 (-) Transcript_40642:165-431(-)